MRIFPAAFLIPVALGVYSQFLNSQGTANLSSSQPAVQQEKKKLTNTDIVGLVKAGLTDSTILLVIEQSPSDFDTSPAALIELKNQGVSPAVMEAMIRARDSAPATGERLGNVQATPDSSKTEGVEILADGAYFKGPTGWVKLERITMAGGGAKHVGKVFVPGLTPQMVWTFRGAEAPVQMSVPRPTFFVKQPLYLANMPGYSERDIVLVRFDKKKDHRELQTTSGGNMLTFKSGYSKERTPDITIVRLSETVFKVTPSGDLQPGEYILTFGSGGVGGYDFGITAKK